MVLLLFCCFSLISVSRLVVLLYRVGVGNTSQENSCLLANHLTANKLVNQPVKEF